MTQTVEAVFDGTVLRPDQPLKLAINTRVWVTVEPIGEISQPIHSLLHTARSLKLEGPPDWSTCLDDDLYGERKLPTGSITRKGTYLLQPNP